MRGLKVCLWVGAIGCLLSVLGLVLPMTAFVSLAKAFGVEGLPDSPLFVYAIRVMSATYVAAGVFLVILARDPVKHGVLVPFMGAASIFVGVVCGASGLISGMPLMWFLGDTISLIVYGIILVALWRRAAGKSVPV